eukprot:505340-Amphidinium_carterae.1
MTRSPGIMHANGNDYTTEPKDNYDRPMLQDVGRAVVQLNVCQCMQQARPNPCLLHIVLEKGSQYTNNSKRS